MSPCRSHSAILKVLDGFGYGVTSTWKLPETHAVGLFRTWTFGRPTNEIWTFCNERASPNSLKFLSSRPANHLQMSISKMLAQRNPVWANPQQHSPRWGPGSKVPFANFYHVRTRRIRVVDGRICYLSPDRDLVSFGPQICYPLY